MTYFLKELSSSHFEIFSSRTSLSLLYETIPHISLQTQLEQIKQKQNRFAALFFLSKLPNNLNTVCGPINFSAELSVEEYYYSENWVPFSLYHNVTRFWLANFCFLNRYMLNRSYIPDIMSETFLTYDKECDFLKLIDVNFIPIKIDNLQHIKISLEIFSNERFVIRPIIPPLTLRAQFNDKCRKESLWNMHKFYIQHDCLVKTIWDKLKDPEREVYCSGYLRRHGSEFAWTEDQENTSDPSEEMSQLYDLFDRQLASFFTQNS